jgi:hypothetical protein
MKTRELGRSGLVVFAIGTLAFQRRGPQLRNDPVAHLTAEYQTELARVSSQDVGAPYQGFSNF